MRDSTVISFLLLLLLFSHRVVSNFLWPPWAASHQASLCFSISQSLLKFMSFQSMMPSNHFILCHLLLLLPSIFPSPTVFSNESALPIWWPSIGASASVLSMNIQGWFPLRLTGLISWPSKGILKASRTTFQRHHSLVLSLLYGPRFTSIHDYWNIQ